MQNFKKFPHISFFFKNKENIDNMAIRLEPKKLIIGNEQSKGYMVLNQASWLQFLHKFSGYNLEVTRQFASTFDGNKAQVGNLVFSISEEYISQVTELPQTGERWFKKQPMDEKSWTPYIRKSRKVYTWVNGVSRNWLKSPWDKIVYLIQKYVTCEGRYSLIFLYHI